MNEYPYLTLEEAAERLGAPIRYVERALGLGDLPSLLPADVDAYKPVYDGLVEYSTRILEGLEPVPPRPDYNLRLIDGVWFDYVNPGTVHDVIHSWAYGFMTGAEAAEMLHLDEGEDIAEIAKDHGLAVPEIEALPRQEVADRLGMPVDNVRHLLASHGLMSCRPADVEARAAFQREKWGGRGTLADLRRKLEQGE